MYNCSNDYHAEQDVINQELNDLMFSVRNLPQLEQDIIFSNKLKDIRFKYNCVYKNPIISNDSNVVAFTIINEIDNYCKYHNLKIA